MRYLHKLRQWNTNDLAQPYSRGKFHITRFGKPINLLRFDVHPASDRRHRDISAADYFSESVASVKMGHQHPPLIVSVLFLFLVSVLLSALLQVKRTFLSHPL
jgi:hypothetical protein